MRRFLVPFCLNFETVYLKCEYTVTNKKREHDPFCSKGKNNLRTKRTALVKLTHGNFLCVPQFGRKFSLFLYWYFVEVGRLKK